MSTLIRNRLAIPTTHLETRGSRFAALARGAAALALLTLAAAPALAQETQVAAAGQGAGYHVYRSHVQWSAPTAQAGDPDRFDTNYRITPSHVEWKGDARPTFPKATCHDWCSGAAGMDPVASYSWDDVVGFFSGR
jgi:hypothetical protein